MGASRKIETPGAQGRFEGFKREILRLGYARPGSLVRRFMPCGNLSCRCAGRPPRLHGPYYQWSCKIAGKTRTLRLSEDQAKLCQKWIRNHKRLRWLVRQMEALSLKKTNRILGAIWPP